MSVPPGPLLRWLGHAAFDLRVGGLRLCLDPHRPGALGGRLRLPPIQGPFDAVVMTHRHEDHAGWMPALGTRRVLDADQELGGVSLRFRPVFHDAEGGLRMGLSRMVSIEGGGLRIVHAGDIGAYGAADLGWLAGTDLLLLPVGGSYTLDGPLAAALVRGAPPRWVVPMHAADPRVALPLHPAAPFIEALGWPAFDLDHFDAAAPPPEGSVLRLAAPCPSRATESPCPPPTSAPCSC